MRTNISLFPALMASVIGLWISACSANVPSRIPVDGDISVAVYPVSENDAADNMDSAEQLEEMVHISELICYPHEEGFTMPFNFFDTVKYAEITGGNIGKRMAIRVNGHVISTPMIKMKIGNGACSVVLDKQEVMALFPTLTSDGLSPKPSR